MFIAALIALAGLALIAASLAVSRRQATDHELETRIGDYTLRPTMVERAREYLPSRSIDHSECVALGVCFCPSDRR